MSKITIDHSDSGVMRATVVRSERITPHMQRVTLTGPDLERLHWRGFDQWVRLIIPTSDPSELDRVPTRITPASYARMIAVPAHRRPTMRSYTLRQWRPEALELDIDFVVHGDAGVAGPWAVRAAAGDAVALVDQGCGWPRPHVANVLLAGDESALPALAGVLRDLPRDIAGVALIELPDPDDVQDVDAPDGVEVRWLDRGHAAPGSAVLAVLGDVTLPDADRHAFAVGASALATGVRRHLVKETGWPKAEVTFCGYWKSA